VNRNDRNVIRITVREGRSLLQWETIVGDFFKNPYREDFMSEEKKVCFVCGNDEDANVLLPCRTEGKDLWVCVRCLPPLIHGQH